MPEALQDGCIIEDPEMPHAPDFAETSGLLNPNTMQAAGRNQKKKRDFGVFS